MKPVSFFFLAIILAGLANSCTNNNKASKDNDINSAFTFDSIVMRKIIKEKTDSFTQAHILKDTVFLNNIFTHDAKVFAPNSEVVMGRPAIAALNANWVNYGIKEFNEESFAFYGNEDYLIDEGSYYLRYGENEIIDKGKYINIWKKENGDWKIHSNIWNTNMSYNLK